MKQNEERTNERTNERTKKKKEEEVILFIWKSKYFLAK